MALFPKLNRKRVGAVVLIAAAICLITAAVWAFDPYRLTTAGLRAAGRVTQLDRHSGSGDSYFPVFVYSDRKGAEHRIYSKIGSYPPSHKMGDAVTVLYLPGHEDSAKLDDWFDFWGAPILLLSLGVVYLLIGAVLCARARIVGMRIDGQNGSFIS
jgi:hypothetical protein